MTKDSRHPLPLEALESDIAILGRKGGGKTITAKGIVERLIRTGHRVLILDPLGGWWGLRSSADGEREGLPVAIFGGDHGDYPLDPALALPLASLIARENLPTILDIADMKQDAQRKFLLAFLQELRRVNRDPLTIVLEEADVFAPQNPQSDLAKDLHGEIDWIARRGRARGFRLITICQRPARLSKDVLTQATTLISHVMPSPQDRDAVKAWVEGNGDRKAAAEVFDTVGNLDVGEAWTWFAHPKEGFLRRGYYPMITTLDTTATPRAGERRIEPKRLAQVDISPIVKALEKAKTDAAPKKKGATTAVETPAQAAPDWDAETIRDIRQEEYRRGWGEGEMAGIERGMASMRATASLVIKEAVAQFTALSESTAAMAAKFDGVIENLPTPELVPSVATPSGGGSANARPDRATKVPRERKTGGGSLHKPDRAGEPAPGADTTQPTQAIIDAIAWWNALGVETPSRVQVAFLAGYSPNSGSFRTYISRVKAAGLMTAANNTFRLTPEGARLAMQPDTAPTFAAVRKRVMSQLGEPAQKIMQHLFNVYPAAAMPAEIAAGAGYSQSGSFRTYMGRVRGLGLVEKAEGGRSRAARFMFGTR